MHIKSTARKRLVMVKSLKSQRGQKRKEKRGKYMRAKIHLPRSSFLSEKRVSSKLTGRKDMGMRGKGVEMGKVNVMWERERQRETQ